MVWQCFGVGSYRRCIGVALIKIIGMANSIRGQSPIFSVCGTDCRRITSLQSQMPHSVLLCVVKLDDENINHTSPSLSECLFRDSPQSRACAMLHRSRQVEIQYHWPITFVALNHTVFCRAWLLLRHVRHWNLQTSSWSEPRERVRCHFLLSVAVRDFSRDAYIITWFMDGRVTQHICKRNLCPYAAKLLPDFRRTRAGVRPAFAWFRYVANCDSPLSHCRLCGTLTAV